jgi:hypothetical protein
VVTDTSVIVTSEHFQANYCVNKVCFKTKEESLTFNGYKQKHPGSVTGKINTVFVLLLFLIKWITGLFPRDEVGAT